MTLDEAIKHCEEKAKELRIEAEQVRDIGEVISNPKQPYNKPVKNRLECAEEYEQLAEWLEELVELRSQRASECEWCKGCKEHDKENHCCHRLSNFIHTQAKEIHDMAYEEGKNDRPKGKWLTIEDRNGEVVLAECSKCGRTVNVACGKTLADYPFCHCGADMGEGGVGE